MSFSYQDSGEGVPIAKEIHGKRIIYLNPQDPDAPNQHCHYNTPSQLECVKCRKRFKSLPGYRYHISKVCLQDQFRLETQQEITPLPTQERQVIFCSGPQNSGKTHRMAWYCYYWSKMFPDRPIIIISRLDHDETFDHDQFSVLERKIQRMKPDQGWLEQRPKLEEFQDCLVCFDDIMCSNWVEDSDYKEQSKMNKMIQSIVEELAIDIAQNGRHHHIGLFVTSHDLYDKGRGVGKMVKDCTDFILYPPKSSEHHLNYFVTEYIGLTKKKLEEMKSIQSRWIWIHKDAPRYFMWDHGVTRYDVITAPDNPLRLIQ